HRETVEVAAAGNVGDGLGELDVGRSRVLDIYVSHALKLALAVAFRHGVSHAIRRAQRFSAGKVSAGRARDGKAHPHTGDGWVAVRVTRSLAVGHIRLPA